MIRYVDHQLSVLQPYLKGVHTVLDFGCGDMALDALMVDTMHTVHSTGIDVIDSKPVLKKHMKFIPYDGVTIPFKDNAFDIVYAYHVFHHCSDPVRALSECKRVTKDRILIVESVLRTTLETPGFMLSDFVANIRRNVHIPMPFHVHTKTWWKRTFNQLHLHVVKEMSVGVFPTWLPIGKTTLFVLKI
jgi:ubiquinone/menaquinone biosynthesis C-methylase UbiE